jgi:hypothetical protein
MNKLKMLVLTAMAAATVGTGALAAAPSASAQRFDEARCKDAWIRWRAYTDVAIIFRYQGDHLWAAWYTQMAKREHDIGLAGC